MALRMFGRVKGLPRPKTPEQWTALYNKHKIELPYIASLNLTCSRYGEGHTGVRLFKADVLPPIKYWNQNMEIDYKKDLEKDNDTAPRVFGKLVNGEQFDIDAKSLRKEDILTRLYALNPEIQASENVN